MPRRSPRIFATLAQRDPEGVDGADGYARHWLNPGEGNPHFLKRSETTLALAKALDNGLERVRDEWIAAPLGLGHSSGG